MLSTLLLSTDSIFAGAVLRFFGTRNLGPACGAVGLADCIALLLGRALDSVIGASMNASEQRTLFACCALAAIIMGRAIANYPRSGVLGIAVLFSVDNLLAGTQVSSLGSTALIACGGGMFSSLSCFVGFYCADVLASHMRQRSAFVLASVVVVISFLVF
jgi:hypothetical protein